ncbi:MAG: acetyl-CoA C-acetyltransferase, partial [Anaerolineae bacterium]
MTTDAYIFDTIRTPRGRGKESGALYPVKPIDLVVTLLKALQERNHLDTAQVDDVVLGCVTPIKEQGAVISRAAVLYADWDVDVPGVQINRFCASGLESVNMAAMKVRSGWEDLVVAGGVESMSRVPMASDGGAMYEDPEVMAHMGFVPQGISADLIATLEGFSREDVDQFALMSQQRAAYARANCHFSRSLIPVKDKAGNILLDKDEHIRADATLEALGSLRPAFQKMGEAVFNAVALQKYPQAKQINHVHTAGNSSGIVDGSALALIGSKEKGEALGLKPRARIRSGVLVGDEPTIMLTGPAPASKKALRKAGMALGDIDLFEVNEAFAAVVLKFMREM